MIWLRLPKKLGSPIFTKWFGKVYQTVFCSAVRYESLILLVSFLRRIRNRQTMTGLRTAWQVMVEQHFPVE